MENKSKQNENNTLEEKIVESFEEMDLDNNLIKGIYSCGFLKPSKI